MIIQRRVAGNGDIHRRQVQRHLSMSNRSGAGDGRLQAKGGDTGGQIIRSLANEQQVDVRVGGMQTSGSAEQRVDIMPGTHPAGETDDFAAADAIPVVNLPAVHGGMEPFGIHPVGQHKDAGGIGAAGDDVIGQRTADNNDRMGGGEIRLLDRRRGIPVDQLPVLRSLLHKGRIQFQHLEDLIYQFAGSSRIVDEHDIWSAMRKADVPERDYPRVVSVLCELEFLGREVAAEEFRFVHKEEDAEKARILASRLVQERGEGTAARFAINVPYHDFLEVSA